MRIGPFIVVAALLSACAANTDSKRAKIAGTAFDNGGTSARTEELQREVRRKGAGDVDAAQQLATARKQDLSAVIAECKGRLEQVSGQRGDSNRIALILSMTGLVAGAIIAPTLIATAASKGAVAFFSGVAGATNTAQSEFRDRGFDADSFATRLTDIHLAIGRRFEQFIKAPDDTARQDAILGLTTDCLVRD